MATAQNINDDRVSDLIEGLRHKDLYQRLKAAMGLADLGSRAESAIRALTTALEEKNKSIHCACLLALYRIGVVPEAVVPILQDAIRDKDELLRSIAALVFSRARPIPREAVSTLAMLLTNDANSWVRVSSAFALCQVQSHAELAIDSLITAVQGTDDDVAFLATVALGNLGPAARVAIRVLQEAVRDPRVPRWLPAVPAVQSIDAGLFAVREDTLQQIRDVVKFHVYRLLGLYLGWVFSHAPLDQFVQDPSETVSTFQQNLQSSNVVARSLAIVTLGQIGAPARDSVPKLFPAFASHHSLERGAAATAFWLLDSPEERRVGYLKAHLFTEMFRTKPDPEEIFRRFCANEYFRDVLIPRAVRRLRAAGDRREDPLVQQSDALFALLRRLESDPTLGLNAENHHLFEGRLLKTLRRLLINHFRQQAGLRRKAQIENMGEGNLELLIAPRDEDLEAREFLWKGRELVLRTLGQVALQVFEGYLYGCTYKEIAQITGLRTQKVDELLNKKIKPLLRQKLAQRS